MECYLEALCKLGGEFVKLRRMVVFLDLKTTYKMKLHMIRSCKMYLKIYAAPEVFKKWSYNEILQEKITSEIDVWFFFVFHYLQALIRFLRFSFWIFSRIDGSPFIFF